MEIGVWPKVVLQPFFTAGQVWRRPQPLQIKSVELNWVKPRTSHEPNWLNWVRLMWSTAFGLDLILVVCFGKVEMRLRKGLGICRPSSIFGVENFLQRCKRMRNKKQKSVKFRIIAKWNLSFRNDDRFLRLSVVLSLYWKFLKTNLISLSYLPRSSNWKKKWAKSICRLWPHF